MDWNWFFSSLCQSAAAIVGFFGGFIITKILGNQATFSEKKMRLQELVRAAEKHNADANSHYFNWYNKRTNENEWKKVDEFLKEDEEMDAEAIYDRLKFSPFTPREAVVRKIDAHILARRARLAREQEARRERAASSNSAFGLGTITSAADIRSYQSAALPTVSILTEELTKEREEIDASLRECRYHVTRVSDFYDLVVANPESSPQITFSLVTVAVLFYIGVMYPLSFMPLAANASPDFGFLAFLKIMWSSKGGLLIAVSLIFSTILAMFFWMNVRLRYSVDELTALKSFCSIGAYSNYFAIKEENDLYNTRRKSEMERSDT